MNNVGKILVFVILVFALLVGGFQLVVFQTRVNWKKAYTELEKEIRIANAEAQEFKDTFDSQQSRIADLEKKHMSAQGAIGNQDKAHAKALKAKMDLVAAAKLSAQKAVDLSAARDKELKLKQTEIGVLRQHKKKLLSDIAALEADKSKYFGLYQDAQNDRAQLLDRLKTMLGRVQVLERLNAKLRAPGKGTATVRSKDQPNPPSFYIKGIIQQVGGTDRSLVKISLGSDHGLKSGHTLDVFRFLPKSGHIGMIRIETVEPRYSLARMVRSGIFGSRENPKKNDIVASQIRP